MVTRGRATSPSSTETGTPVLSPAARPAARPSLTRQVVVPRVEVDVVADPFLRLSPLEAMLSVPLELATSRRAAEASGSPTSAATSTFRGTPRAAFEQVVAETYAADPDRPPYVLFSGGRDSSAVLAVAVDHARRTGRADPVPVIVRHVDDPAADETSWQELVLAHLGIDRPVVLTFRDEQRLLGGPARASLRARGPVWPAAVTLHSAIYRELGPGQLLTGEGGDHTLLPQRITPLRNGLHYRRPTQVAGGLVQLLTTRASRRGPGADGPPWLTPDGLRITGDALRSVSRLPVRFDRSMLALFGSVFDEILLHNFGAMAATYGLVAVHPFVDARFRTAWARDGGAFGYAGRNDNMRRLFADVLPDPILVRATKADFTASRWGDGEREFAETWDGSGVDPALIRADELRRDWLAPTPHPFSEYLLHHVWASTRPVGPEGPA